MCLNTHGYTKNTQMGDSQGGGIRHRHGHVFWKCFESYKTNSNFIFTDKL